MIITKTPLRLSLFGGGTDLPEFYTRRPGAVVSFAINKYIYVSVNEKFDGRTRVSYSKTEDVDEPWKLEHDLARETMGYYGLKGLEITSVSDIPGEGSGLGSSSAFTVGLVTALMHKLRGDIKTHPSYYAQMAYDIERNGCDHSVGKQDHYAAAFGGLHYYQFNPDGSVNAELIHLTEKLRHFLEGNVMLFWTGRTRKADTILKEQADRLAKKETIAYGEFLAGYAQEARNLLEDGKFDKIGLLMDWAWKYKKELTNVSDEEIDMIYSRAKLSGALGGKICGAGGGGFLMLIADPVDQSAIENAVGLRRVRFCIEECGSRVIYNDK